MTDNGKVTVKIYGQEYTFSSEAKSKDRIIRVCNHVDDVVTDIASGVKGSISQIAILAAVNIADEYLALEDAKLEDEREKEQLQKDVAHITQLWEEAKKNFLENKEETRVFQEQKDAILEKYNAQIIELENLHRENEQRASRISELEQELESFQGRLRNANERRSDNSEQIKELEDKLKEVEGTYFELQMENIQIKGELERFREGE
ncbi:MAG: cell division protein ZapA [Clostridiales Family XIII bacterium]|jgi:cell division protein ZapA|nr:cell division protein ZapA [Clostridiales Family XIII bacterium]